MLLTITITTIIVFILTKAWTKSMIRRGDEMYMDMLNVSNDPEDKIVLRHMERRAQEGRR